MRENIFVKQNEERWKKFELLLTDKYTDNPDEVTALYIDLIDDLSYSRTFYPGTPTSKYLNELAGRAHQVIYQNKKEKRNRFVQFWVKEVPEVMYAHQKQLFIAFSIFMVSAIVGAVSAAHDNSFVRLILGDNYVDMTIENIKKGHPLGVYDSQSPFYMYVRIAFNNIRVAFLTYVLGSFFSVGTAYFLFVNGIMLGSFQYFFYQYGVLEQSVLTIWLHGTIEISVCIISGCAGLILGNSILFPGTYTRAQSFRQGAIDGLKIVTGTVPFFLIAAFIESFVTRHAEVSKVFDIMLILLSLILIIGYFIVYPIYVQRKLTTKPLQP